MARSIMEKRLLELQDKIARKVQNDQIVSEHLIKVTKSSRDAA